MNEISVITIDNEPKFESAEDAYDYACKYYIIDDGNWDTNFRLNLENELLVGTSDKYSYLYAVNILKYRFKP